MKTKQQDNPSLPFQEGDRIAAIARFERHSYQQGFSYVVIETDHNDQTLKAQDPFGRVGEWIPWTDCVPTLRDCAA